MTKTKINVSWQCFWKSTSGIGLLFAVIFVLCGNIQKVQAQTDSIYGNFQCNNNETAIVYRLELSSPNKIKMSTLGYYDVVAEYQGTFSKQSDNGDYTFEVRSYSADYQAPTIDGSFVATIDSGGLLHFTLKSDLANFGNKGKKFVLHKPGAAITIELPVKPNVLDLFKAAFPLTFDGVIRDAYNFIVLGRSNYLDGKDQHKTVDLSNGYIKYEDDHGTPPAVIECCYWKCSNGDYLFAINVFGELPDMLPTREMLFYSFDMEKKTVQFIDPPYTLEKPDTVELSFQLPRKGKNIKVIYLNEDYTDISSTVLKWNGQRFEK